MWLEIGSSECMISQSFETEIRWMEVRLDGFFGNNV
jgi:hypothetical protein